MTEKPHILSFLFPPESCYLGLLHAIDTNPDLSYLEVDWAGKPNKQVGGANCSLTSQPHLVRMVVD